jgi:uncharacterized membrane protein YhaH (DUF805 family)
MGFGQAIAAGFTNYINFAGRATRPEYWYFILFLVLAGIVTGLIDYGIFGTTEIGPVNGIFSLATLLPSIAVAIRRLHDIGRTGWWVLLSFVPIVGWIILIYWACQPGDPGPNAYGPPPSV